jgi:hypothetical protein
MKRFRILRVAADTNTLTILPSNKANGKNMFIDRKEAEARIEALAKVAAGNTKGYILVEMYSRDVEPLKQNVTKVETVTVEAPKPVKAVPAGERKVSVPRRRRGQVG